MSEWPLIVFTVAIQLAGGLALAATCFDWAAASSDMVMRPLGLAVFPLAALGLLVSLFHLGRPLAAWKSLLNLSSSRLSLEILLTLLFVGAALLYSHAWWAERADHRFALGVVTSVVALSAVVSSSSIYLIPTQPAWNSSWVPVSFIGTTLLLGGCAAAVVANLQGTRQFLGFSLGGAVVGSLMLIGAAIWMLSSWSRGAPDEFTAAQLQGALQLVTQQHPIWLGLHLVLAGVLPIVFAVLVWFGRSQVVAPSWMRILLFLAISSGAVIGRKLMYLAATAPGRF